MHGLEPKLVDQLAATGAGGPGIFPFSPGRPRVSTTRSRQSAAVGHLLQPTEQKVRRRSFQFQSGGGVEQAMEMEIEGEWWPR